MRNIPIYKKFLRSIKRKLKNTFKVKVPVSNPVLYGQLLKGRTALITGGTSGIGYAIAQAFLRNEATVINISSSSSVRPASNSYGLAKWGIRGMTLGLAKHLSPDGIVVNAIAPGPTATSMLLAEGEKSISRPSSPSERYATPEEIANLSVILASELGRMVNGDTLYVTGGCGLLTFDDWG